MVCETAGTEEAIKRLLCGMAQKNTLMRFKKENRKDGRAYCLYFLADQSRARHANIKVKDGAIRGPILALGENEEGPCALDEDLAEKICEQLDDRDAVHGTKGKSKRWRQSRPGRSTT